jgi:cell division protein FtsL
MHNYQSKVMRHVTFGRDFGRRISAMLAVVLFSKNTAIVLMLLCLFFAVGYVIKINTVSGRGYEMRHLEKEIKVLEHEMQRLEFNITTLASSKKLEERATQLGFVQPKDVRYVSVGATVVVKR